MTGEIQRIIGEPTTEPAWLMHLALTDWQDEKQILMEDLIMHTFSSGAKSTVEKPRYDLVPLEAIQYMAERFAYGASRHGDRNWEQGINDEVFIRDRKNHALEHFMHYMSTGDKDQLKAAICNLGMLAAIEERRTR